MDKTLYFIVSLLMLLVWTVLVFLPIKNSIHMYQQNRYELRRYLPWLKGEFFFQLKNNRFWSLPYGIALILGVLSYFYPLIGSFISIGLGFAYGLFLFYLDRSTQRIKPLKLTHRVLRQIFVFFLIMSLEFMLISQSPMYVRIIFTPLMMSLSWITMVLVALITMPFEAFIRNLYMLEAKRILKQHPHLLKIGVTGSYGKTSTKNILAEVLGENYYVLSTPASFNTPMGLTITIREHLKSLHQVFIAEMGADKVGEISSLSRFIQPEIGVVTAVGPQHLNTFKNIENILHEKTRLIETLPHKGCGIYNVDNEYLRNYAFKNPCKKLSYGIDHPADLNAIDIEYSPSGSSFTLVYQNTKTRFQTRLLGKHNISNILSALAVGIHLGIPMDKLQTAVRKVNFIEHRLQLKTLHGLRFIDNAYNSNPEGAMMSLDVLKTMPGKRYIITPGMIDLGNQQSFYNHAFGAYMKDRADVVILVGKHQTKDIFDGLKYSGFDMDQVFVFDHVHQAFDYVQRNASIHDMILLENDLPDAFSR